MTAVRVRTHGKRLLGVALAVLAGVGPGCAVNPATGRPELLLVSPAEARALGRELDTQLVREGAVYGDHALTAYVAAIGRHVARVSERPDLTWTFRILDEPVINAFAAPGGYVYVARDLLALLQSEAELAAVLAHEVGHVAARHSAHQISRAAVAARGVGLLRVIDPHMRHVAGLAAGTARLALLRHSREQELQADTLGARYLRGAGYPPGAMADILALLATLSTGDSRPPPWLASHPDPRVRLAALARAGLQPTDPAPRPAFVARLDGLAVGPDPRRGYVQGARFVHPRAGFAVTFPRGWPVERDQTGALALAPDGAALVMVGVSPLPDATTATAAFFTTPGLVHGASETVRVGRRAGLATAFRVPDARGDVAGVVTFLGPGPGLVMIAAFATAASWGLHSEGAAQVVSSVRDPTAREAAVAPVRLSVRVLDAPATLRELDPSGPTAWLAQLNRVAPDVELPPGRPVKLLDRRGLPPP